MIYRKGDNEGQRSIFDNIKSSDQWGVDELLFYDLISLTFTFRFIFIQEYVGLVKALI
mgnify:CR=1 FL=1